MIRSHRYIGLLAGAIALGTPAWASVAVSAQEVVQALPNPAQAELSDALRRLSRNPESVPALVAAGNASLALGDVDAALGFFNRAQDVDPDDGRMLLGLGRVAVRRGEGLIAVQLFDNAEAAGQQMGPVAGDRGLAYDLVGNNARAQRFYRQALSRDENNEVIRRLALSYAISGDAAASDATLLPLLQRQDRAAYRARAFALAILGRDQEAITIAETMLPQRLAVRLAPYLRYMPYLSRAQQAAAANLGRFPSASQVGREPSQIAAREERAEPAAAAPRTASERLTPSGEPLGRPAPPARDANGELPALAAAETPVSETPAEPASEGPDVDASELGREPVFAVADESRPSFSLTTNNSAGADAPAAETEITEVEQRSAEQLGLQEAFADFVLPTGRQAVAPTQGAVDITAIEPAREAPEPPPPPAHPSRHWVQVATGQDTAAFRFDWRRIVRNADGLLDGREAFTARWNSTNRLLTGPFDSAGEAQQVVTELAEAGVDAFRFTSAEGEEVRPIE